MRRAGFGHVSGRIVPSQVNQPLLSTARLLSPLGTSRDLRPLHKSPSIAATTTSSKRSNLDTAWKQGGICHVGQVFASRGCSTSNPVVNKPVANDTKPAKPLEQWSPEEVQQWLKDAGYGQYADQLANLTGKVMANVSREDLQKELGNLAGSAIYSELQALVSAKKASTPAIQELFLNMYKENPILSFKGVKNVNEYTPHFLPFKDREREIEQVAKTVCGNFMAFLARSSDTKHWGLLAVTGGSGTGKTRFSVNSLNFVRAEISGHREKYISFIKTKRPTDDAEAVYNDLVKSLDVSRADTYYVNFSNGDWLDEWKHTDQTTQESAFLLTLAAKAFFPRDAVGTIRERVTLNELRAFTTNSVAQALRERYGLGPQERVTIFIDIDEFQTKVYPDDLAVIASQGEKDGLLIRRIALVIMSVVRKMASQGVHVVPIFSGTLSADYAKVLPVTLYYLVNILMPPLRSESSLAAVEEALSKYISENIDLPPSLIEAMGGIGRGLEFLVQVLNDIDPKEFNANTVFQKTADLISDKYQLSNSMAEETFLWLVRYCLSGQKVYEHDMIPPSNAPLKYPRAPVTLATLQKDGILFLEKTGRETEKTFRVIMPLVFAATLNVGLSVFPTALLTYEPIVDPTSFEKFARDFEVLKTEFLIDLGVTETTFGERYFGALMSERLKAKPISLRQLTAFDSKSEQFPTNGTSIEVFHSSRLLNMKEDAVALWIGRKCDVGDTVYSYPGQEAKGSGPERKTSFIILEEAKSTNPLQEVKDPNLYPARIRDEIDDALKADRVFNSRDGYEVFFHFLSNKRLASTDDAVQHLLKNDRVMITTKAQFRDRFSPIFAPIALRIGEKKPEQPGLEPRPVS